jgi:predicted nucleotidyltransferase
MPEVSRPATLDDLKTLARALNERGARYLLIGGWALFAHGLQRATVDVDLLVPPGAQSAQALTQALLVMPDQAAREIDPAWFEDSETIRVADAWVVDLMFRACGETYESLLPYAKTIDLDGVPVVTVTLEGLLRTKQSYREKDALDRVAIERVLAGLGENLEDDA